MKNILIGLLIIYILIPKIKAENNTVFVKRFGVTEIVLFDGKNSNKIFQSNKKAVYDIKVSPNNQYISAIEVNEGVIEGHGYKILPKNSLVVISSNGKLINEIKRDIRKYDWSPTGNKLVCITGSYHEGGDYGFLPDGEVFIYDLSTNEIKNIEGIRFPYQVYWGISENKFYIKDAHKVNGKRVYKYSLESDNLVLTDYHDIYFSPNETYYIRYPDMSHNFAIFETETNQEVQLPNNLGKPKKWIFDYGNLLLFEKKDETIEYHKMPETKPGSIKPFVFPKKRTLNSVSYSIYDVKKEEIIKEKTTDMINEWIGNKFSAPIQTKGENPNTLILD